MRVDPMVVLRYEALGVFQENACGLAGFGIVDDPAVRWILSFFGDAGDG